MSDIKIGRMMLGAVQTNCYFIYREGSNKVVFFDPADSGSYIYEQLKNRGFEVAAIYLTHAHFDHIWGCNELRELSGAKVYACEAERALCEDSMTNVSAQAGRPYTVKVDEYLRDGQVCTEGDISFKVIHTPGHTIGSCCYYVEEAGLLICGDTLFCESVGRTDLPTGSESTLIRSISDKLMSLPDETKVYPGHGSSTTIGYERDNNPFIMY
ncbi:MAG: MBL fold metallo-hydrolase [Lachnospiraceae bacterium]|nr:MBL fold metallo-hydrolase [Lachnospiraceae bacterium]